MTENLFPYKLPKNWHWTKVGHLVTLHRGVSYKKNDAHKIKENGDCLIIRGGNIGEGYINLNVDNVYVNEQLVDEIQLIKKNDMIVVASTGSKKVIGRVGICKKNYHDISFGAFLILVRPSDMINANYINYFFQSNFYRNRIRNLATGVNINNIRSEHITDMPIPLPPIDEQKKIVERIESLFSKLDKAKSIVQKILDGYELRRSAILHKAFTGELTKNFRAENNLSLGDWQEKTLGEVCKINPPKISTQNLSDELKVSFFPMSSLSEVEGKITNPQIKKLGEVKSGYTNFSEGDVVFAKITPCMENGKSAVIEKLLNDIGYGTTEFFVFRCEEKIFNKLLYHLVRSKKFIAVFKNKISIPNAETIPDNPKLQS